MPKPPGIQLGNGPDGPTLRVSRITRTEDLLWDAVETAQAEGWDAKRFVSEAREAWEDTRKRALRDELNEFS
jgi:hypothetical protein